MPSTLANTNTVTGTNPCDDLDWLWLTWLSVLSKCSWPAPLTLLVINQLTNLILTFRIRVSEKKWFLYKQELVTGTLPVIVENLDVQCYFVNIAMRVILRTTKDTLIETMWFILHLPPMQTDRKWSRSNHTWVPLKIPTTHSMKQWKTQKDTDWDGQVLDGSSRRLSTASMLADRAQANQGVGKVPKPIPASLWVWDAPARKWPAGKTESEIKLLIQENSKPQDLIVYTDGSVTKYQSGWGFTVIVKHGVTTNVPSVKTVQPIQSQPPAWQSPMSSAGLP